MSYIKLVAMIFSSGMHVIPRLKWKWRRRERTKELQIWSVYRKGRVPPPLSFLCVIKEDDLTNEKTTSFLSDHTCSIIHIPDLLVCSPLAHLWVSAPCEI